MHLLDEDFFLKSGTGRRLYRDYAEKLPIIDYHSHISPEDIARDRRFENITEVWLEGDHYKWRLMRWAGVDEKYITGNAAPLDKFKKWAGVLQKSIGNPIYLWSRLELKRHFGIDEPLTPENAERIYGLCGEMISSPEFCAKGLIKKSAVEYVCTTDDPADTLEWHKKIKKDGFDVNVAPAWRPDKAINLDAYDYKAYIEKLSASSGVAAEDYAGLKSALSVRLDFFHENGCRISDHGPDFVYYSPLSEYEAGDIFKRALNGDKLTSEEIYGFKTSLMLFLCEEYARRGWVSQLHYGCRRNANSLMKQKLGENTGFDCIANYTPSEPLTGFLNALAMKDRLPKTILYSLNPSDNQVIASIAGSFQEGGTAGKVQHGSAWWFNDHADGMRDHLRSLASIGYLPAFVGMLTDGRSLLSYSRHEYFRRILCGLIGGWVDAGEYPEDFETLGNIITDISYRNAKSYFGI